MAVPLFPYISDCKQCLTVIDTIEDKRTCCVCYNIFCEECYNIWLETCESYNIYEYCDECPDCTDISSITCIFCYIEELM